MNEENISSPVRFLSEDLSMNSVNLCKFEARVLAHVEYNPIVDLDHNRKLRLFFSIIQKQTTSEFRSIPSFVLFIYRYLYRSSAKDLLEKQ